MADFNGQPQVPAAVRHLEFVHLDGTKMNMRDLIGMGGTGIVIRQGDNALKFPNFTKEVEIIDGKRVNGTITPPEGSYDHRAVLKKVFEGEKAIYQRLGDHPGIVRCLNALTPDHMIRMPLMINGDLRHYLAKVRPTRERQLTWLIGAAQTLAYIHSRRVVMTDLRLDNLLLDDEWALKFADFGNSILMPLEWNLEGTVDEGFSILTDIGQFGRIMFEVIAGRKCKFDLFQKWKEPGDQLTFPRRDSLPSTSGVWLGHIIEKCWTRGFRSATDLATALNQEHDIEISCDGTSNEIEGSK